MSYCLYLSHKVRSFDRSRKLKATDLGDTIHAGSNQASVLAASISAQMRGEGRLD
jgi:hypothetical protein